MKRPPSKTALKEELLSLLAEDLRLLEQAQKATLAGATHAEAKPENDKDTRALELSYLARGQSERVEETRVGIVRVQAMAAEPFPKGTPISVGALVCADGEDGAQWFLMAPFGGGTKLAKGSVQVVTPKSPLGAALVGKVQGDDGELRVGGKLREFTVASIH